MTTAINTPLASVLSQLLVHSLTSRPATSGASLFQPLTSSEPTASCTPETPSSNVSFAVKPANTKSTHPFLLTFLTIHIKRSSGCHALFRDDHGQALTIILGHKERNWYVSSKWPMKFGEAAEQILSLKQELYPCFQRISQHYS